MDLFFFSFNLRLYRPVVHPTLQEASDYKNIILSFVLQRNMQTSNSALFLLTESDR